MFFVTPLVAASRRALRARLWAARRLILQRRIKIRIGLFGKRRPQRRAQIRRRDFLDRAVVELAQFERPVTDADQPVHR
jgi:hypothetical protein